MCVICYKPLGTPLPKYFEDTCWNCYQANPDGAGIAFVPKGSKQVHIWKGFFNFDELMDKVNGLFVYKSDILALHFRIATSGNVDATMCHPFPVTDKVTLLQASEAKVKRCFLHNGIFGEGKGALSDTAVFIREKLVPALRKTCSLQRAMQETFKVHESSNRVLTIDAETLEVAMYGNWIHDKATGLYFSNNSYQGTFYEWEDQESFCPVCGQWADLISSTHKLYECEECHTVFQGKDIILESPYFTREEIEGR